MNRERLIELAQKACIHIIFDSKFGRPEYQSVCATWPEIEAFTRLVLKEAAGEPVAWMSDTSPLTLHTRALESLSKIRPSFLTDYPIPLYTIKEIEL